MKVATISLVTLALGCGGARVAARDDRAAVAAVLEAQRQAWNRGDLLAYMDGYERSPDLIFTSGGQIRRGWDETLARYRRTYGQDRTSMGQLGFEILDLRPIGADAAVVLGRWRLTGLAEPKGGVFTVVFARRPEGWRIVHDHTSSD
jgi:ketosteroid isomerase-like protein